MKKVVIKNTPRLRVSLRSDRKLFIPKVVCCVFLFLTTISCLTLPDLGKTSLAYASNNEKVFAGYYESWSDKWTINPQELELVNIAPYVNMVIVSFIKPDASYTKGSYNLKGTGLLFASDGKVVKSAIANLKKRNPKTKVLVSIGGETYTNYAKLNPRSILNVVQDFGFDGVDIDYEPTDAGCESFNGKINCTTDTEFRRIVRQIRQVLPRPYLVTAAVWSIGAYGEGKWANSLPKGEKTGISINLLRSPEGKAIDQLNVMSYNVGTIYNPHEALAAYQNYFKNKIVMGIQVPPEAWRGNIYTLAKVRNLAEAVIANNASGLMLWSLQKQPEGIPSENNPNAEAIAKTACHSFSLSNCSQPLF